MDIVICQLLTLKFNPNVAVIRRKFDCVGEQVNQNLLNPHFVHFDVQIDPLVKLEFNLDIFGLSLELKYFCDFLNNRPNIFFAQ